MPTKNRHPAGTAPSGLPHIPKTPIGVNPATGRMEHNFDLSALDEWAAEQGYDDGPNPIPIVNTGPASAGLVQLEDGTLYDVTDRYIVAASPEHAHELHHHVGVQHERTGRFDVAAEHTDDGKPVRYRHTDCKHCDAPKTEHLEHPAARTAVASGKEHYLDRQPVSKAKTKAGA
jgi:hypothetical protein